jgi:hypothetical protein
MRVIINNLHPKGTGNARSWINDWPSHNHSSIKHMRVGLYSVLLAVLLPATLGCQSLSGHSTSSTPLGSYEMGRRDGREYSPLCPYAWPSGSGWSLNDWELYRMGYVDGLGDQ